MIFLKKTSLQFRKATEQDVPTIMTLLNAGKQWMKSKGPEQWPSFYPNQEIVMTDVGRQESYVLEEVGEGQRAKKEGKIVGTFSVARGPEEYYERLVEGQWLNKGNNYAVCGRMAIEKSQKGKGLGQLMITQVQRLCRQAKYRSIRVSTYEHNTRVKQLMVDNKYKFCGKFQVPGKVLLLGYELLLEDDS